MQWIIKLLPSFLSFSLSAKKVALLYISIFLICHTTHCLQTSLAVALWTYSPKPLLLISKVQILSYKSLRSKIFILFCFANHCNLLRNPFYKFHFAKLLQYILKNPFHTKPSLLWQKLPKPLDACTSDTMYRYELTQNTSYATKLFVTKSNS